MSDEMKWIRRGIFAVVGLAILFTLLSSFYSVEQGDRAVLTRWGKVVAVQDPGLHFKTPWIESATHMTVREQRLRYKMEAYSRDQQPAEVIVSVNYKLLPSDVESVYTNLGTDYIEKLVSTQLPKKLKEVFGLFNAETIVADRTRLGADVESAVQGVVDARGVQIVSVQIEDVSFSDTYEKSIEERMQAQVASVKAEADKLRRMTEADAAAYEVKAAADAEAHAVMVRGEAEATAIKARAAALKENQALVELTAVEKWNGALPTTQVPGSAVPFINVR